MANVEHCVGDRLTELPIYIVHGCNRPRFDVVSSRPANRLPDPFVRKLPRLQIRRIADSNDCGLDASARDLSHG
jgi:hypothetical protein